MNCVKKGAVNSRPAMAWPAAARSLKAQGHSTPMTGPRGSEVDRQTGAGDDDLVLWQFPAIEMHGWLILISGENNRGPFPARRDVQDTRQTFVAALHPQAVEVNARQLGTVFAATDDDPLYPRASHVRMVCIGVGECYDLAVRHWSSPEGF